MCFSLVYVLCHFSPDYFFPLYPILRVTLWSMITWLTRPMTTFSNTHAFMFQRRIRHIWCRWCLWLIMGCIWFSPSCGGLSLVPWVSLRKRSNILSWCVTRSHTVVHLCEMFSFLLKQSRQLLCQEVHNFIGHFCWLAAEFGSYRDEWMCDNGSLVILNIYIKVQSNYSYRRSHVSFGCCN